MMVFVMVYTTVYSKLLQYQQGRNNHAAAGALTPGWLRP